MLYKVAYYYEIININVHSSYMQTGHFAGTVL
jgi:hypothetical protein